MTDKMTKRLTPDLIAETLGEYDGIYSEQLGDDYSLFVDHKGMGEASVTLWKYDEDEGHDVEVDARTFRIVEVES
mgnify:CR=1 FL=1